MSEYNHTGLHEIQGNGMLLLPNLINGHSHVYSTFARGLSVPFDPHSFQELLEQLWWKVDRNLTLDAVYHSGLVSGVDYLKHGVTTIIDHHASGAIQGSLHQLHKAFGTVGLRHDLCFETSDRFDVNTCIQENITALTAYQTEWATAHFGLHASFSLSDDTLAKISKQLNQAPIHIHVAESKDDQDHCVNQYGKRVIERLDEFGLIQPDAILVHCNHLSDQEYAIIKQRQAVIAVNPTSNMNNGVGLPDVRTMMNHHIPVIIGNDGIHRDMTREYQSIYYAMHHNYQSPTGFSMDQLQHIIQSTYQYASRRFGVQLGRIEPGYQADFFLLPYPTATPIHTDNALAHLFFGLFGECRAHSVYVNGQQLVHNYQVSPTLQNVSRDASAIANDLWNAIQKEGTV